MSDKDIKRFSFSRFKTYQGCGRKHFYQYVEQIETEESEYTIPGKLFHLAFEKYMKGEDFTEPLKEFDQLCFSGKLPLEPGTLTQVFQMYLAYYDKQIKYERNLMIEETLEEKLEDDDYLILVVDQVVEINGQIILRDHKTTTKALKYTWADVNNNQQLLLYVPYVEQKLGIKISAVEIDEIRIAKLGEVPLNANGKPTIDKKRLDLVTHEQYLSKLTELGLEGEGEYQFILDHLQSRGHPLFKRIRVQLLDDKPTQANLEDMWNTYKSIKNSVGPARNRNILCNYCPFKQLCDLDMSNPSEADRKIMIDKIKANK
jgi:CRISPR/Cas system-associated exonuclease Cas4 (RecB family)